MGPQPRLICCYRNYKDTRTPSDVARYAQRSRQEQLPETLIVYTFSLIQKLGGGGGACLPWPPPTDWVFIPVGVMGSCSGPPSRPLAGRRNRCDAFRRRWRQAWPAMDCDPGTQSVHFGGVLVTRVAREHQSCCHAHPNFRVHQSHVLPILAEHNRRHWGSRGRVSHTAKRGNLRPLQGDSS